MAISRFLHLLVACLLVTLSVGAQAAAPTRDEELTIVVVDRGIRQKPGWRTKGHGGLSWIYNEITKWAQIPVVMPSRKDFSDISTAVMRRSIYEDLKARVSAARAAGNSRIEIQLVEDISAFGYLDPDNQRDVDRFGAAAYGAIVDINRELSAKGVRVRNEAVLGSNGTKVWAANVENWRIDGKSIWASVDLYDGRAEMLSAVRAIKAAGPSIVRIFNTRGDIWGLDLVGFGESVVSRGLIQNYFQSIAKVQTTTAIKDLIPEVKVYYLRRNGFF